MEITIKIGICCNAASFLGYLHIIYIFREAAGIHTLKIYIYDSVFEKKTSWASIIILLLIEKPK